MIVLSFCHVAVLLYDASWLGRAERAALGKLHTYIIILMMEYTETGSTARCLL